MLSKGDWEKIENTDFVSVKWMLIIVVTLSVIVQSVAQLFQPSFWINYQLLAFILATNVGAVVSRQDFANVSSGFHARVLSGTRCHHQDLQLLG